MLPEVTVSLPKTKEEPPPPGIPSSQDTVSEAREGNVCLQSLNPSSPTEHVGGGARMRRRGPRLSLPNISNLQVPSVNGPDDKMLINACKSKKKNVEEILNIIKTKPDLILIADGEGKLPLHHAAVRKPVEVIDALVFPHRETIFSKDSCGKTALDYANQYYANENVVVALNDKRRRLRDENARQAREAEEQLVRDQAAKTKEEAEDIKRMAGEEIDDVLKTIVESHEKFCKSSNENTTPFDLAAVETLAEMVGKVKDMAKEAHGKIEGGRLEGEP